ncbi:hypothetical protein BSKO_08808 [Bryopsis sp. KO-2023]|nr:hypothetical protein BSKO_08808 [Bryopsis sp. KO-2023]
MKQDVNLGDPKGLDDIPIEDITPEKKSPGLLSKLVFSFISPVVRQGRHVRLEEKDLLVREDLEAEKLHDRFAAAWEREQKRDNPKILRAVVAGTWSRLIFTGVLNAISMSLSFVGPLILNRIVAGLTCRSNGDDDCPSKKRLYEYAAVLFLAPMLQSLIESHMFFQLNMYGTSLRNGLMAAIYRKCLRADTASLSDTSTGKIVTLMSVDAQKVQDATLAIHALWSSPVMVSIILVLLYNYVGWAAFVGLAVMLSLGPAAGRLSKSMGSLQRSRAAWTDKRVGLVNEIINGIRVIKFYAWESSFVKRVQEYRNEEGKILRKLALAFGGFAMLLFVGPVFVAIACFSTYSLAGNNLTTADAYTALAFFTILRMPLSFLPMFITMAVNAMVGLKRIQGFLSKPDAEDGKANEGVEKGLVEVQDGTFRWDNSREEPSLRNITFSAQPGSVTMIVGAVGSGKSSLLASLIRQIGRVSGTVKVGGSVAYVAQTAWIINDTVRENIILGGEYDPERYEKAIEVAQLTADLKSWERGDMTEIGERGITMSGGQKQRVSIARAVYADADVYIFDDPLSAVDAHVGKALFDDCIKGALLGKTIILVSNAVQYLPQADRVIWLEDGAIKAMGQHDDLARAGFNMSDVTPDTKESTGSVRRTSSGFESIPESDEGSSTGDSNDDDPDVESASSDSSPRIQANVEKMDAENTSDNNLHTIARPGKPEKKVNFSIPNSDKKVLPGKANELNKETGISVQGKSGKELTGIEDREGGSIGREVLGRYGVAVGGAVVITIALILLVLEQACKIFTDRWVGLWASDELDAKVGFYIGIYALSGIIFGGVAFLRTVQFSFSHVRASLQLHDWLLVHMLKLPMRFYDTNPSGRIVNRFSRDVDVMDGTLLQSMSQFLRCIGTFFGILLVICMATPLFTPFLVPITLIYFVIQRWYIPSARELQRLESITRSPIYTGFGETINGVATIRAYGLTDHFVNLSNTSINRNASAFYTQKAASGWLSTRLDIIGLITLMLAGVLAVQGGIDPALAGLSLVYALDLTKFLKHGTTTASQTESNFNSVERIVQYLKPEIEGNVAIETGEEPEEKLPENWPTEGKISIKNVSMKYRDDTPLVVKDVSLDIKAGEKIGIAGRTGSGKSSFFLVLYRMVEAAGGSIEIDGVDITKLKLSTLRSAMSMIPQDPFMFSGTIRLNLDPFDTYPDAELWQALAGVGLKETIEKFPEKLSTTVVDNGSNFSQGQRQLFCLARALLRKSKILMMDEATASVDVETDALIQNTIRKNMKDATVLTIAHRVNTIMDSDRVLVMDHGHVAEFGVPQELLKMEDGFFSGLVRKSRKGRAILAAGTFRMGGGSDEKFSTVSEEGGSEEGSRPLQKSASGLALAGCSTVEMYEESEGEDV